MQFPARLPGTRSQTLHAARRWHNHPQGGFQYAYQYRSTAASGDYEAIKTMIVRSGWTERPPVTMATTYSFTGAASIQYRRVGTADWTTCRGPFKVSAAGTWTCEYRSTDLVGVAESPQTFVLRIGAKPKITALSPTAARRGAAVILSGTAFDKTRSTSYVVYGTRKRTSYVSCSTRVKVRVPTKAAHGATKVKLVTKIGTSNTKSFTVKR